MTVDGAPRAAASDAAVRVALVTTAEARDLDDDLPPLVAALADLGAHVDVVDWRDDRADWGRFDLALVRSTWDYHAHIEQFRDWIDTTSRRTTLCNPGPVLRWNTDKRYLRDLADAGVPVVPTTFLAPDDPGPPDRLPLATTGEVVVKPAVSAGARDAARYLLDEPDERTAATGHVERLLADGRVVMVQPYLASVDSQGETAVVVVDGLVSHALRKGPLLERGRGPVEGLFAVEDMAARAADDDELAVVDTVVAHLGDRFDRLPLYARVDLLTGPDGAPVVLELELTEPSLFFDFAPGSARRFARAALARLP